MAGRLDARASKAKKGFFSTNFGEIPQLHGEILSLLFKTGFGSPVLRHELN
jgi:hypothetical protein